MITFNIIFGVVLLIVILLIPYIKKQLKKKYSFEFSPSKNKIEPNLKQEKPIKPPISEAISFPKEVQDETTSPTPENKTKNPDDNEEKFTSTDSPHPEEPANTKTDITTEPTIETPKIEATPLPTTKTKKPKIQEETITQTTFYILPKEQPGQIEALQGDQIINALLNQNNEGEIKFNAEEGCFSHYTKTHQLVYNIYKATEPVTFPNNLDDVNNIVTTGLMLNIQFPVANIPDVYAYNNYFRHTAKRVAELLDYKIYDEKLNEWTDKKLEDRRKAIIRQKQGFLL